MPKVVRQFNGLEYHYVKWCVTRQMEYRLRRHWSRNHMFTT